MPSAALLGGNVVKLFGTARRIHTITEGILAVHRTLVALQALADPLASQIDFAIESIYDRSILALHKPLGARSLAQAPFDACAALEMGQVLH